VYQSGSDVYATKSVESTQGGVCAQVIVTLDDTRVMDYPSIALKQVDVFTLPEGGYWERIYSQGEKQNDYDFTAGSGWVDSLSIGRVFIRQYPWVYSEEKGWLYTVDAGVFNRDQGKPVLGFWFWSQTEETWFFRLNSE